MQVLLKTFFLFLIFRIIILCIIENIVLLHDFFYSLFLKFYSFILNYGCLILLLGIRSKFVIFVVMLVGRICLLYVVGALMEQNTRKDVNFSFELFFGILLYY